MSASDYRQRRAERDALVARMHEREFLHDLSDVVPSVGMNTGISPGQYTRVVLHTSTEHGTAGAVHVALQPDGRLHVAIEYLPDLPITQRRIIRRTFWRFYDFWRYDREKHDNVPRPPDEWPTILEVPSDDNDPS